MLQGKFPHFFGLCRANKIRTVSHIYEHWILYHVVVDGDRRGKSSEKEVVLVAEWTLTDIGIISYYWMYFGAVVAVDIHLFCVSVRE